MDGDGLYVGSERTGEAVSLVAEAQADIAEMAKVSSNEHVNIFYQLHANGVPERSHVGVKVEPVPEDMRDNTRGEALIEFISMVSTRSGSPTS